MTAQEVLNVVSEGQRPIIDRLDRIDKRVESIARQRTLALAVAVVCLLVAAAAVFYGINRGAALQDQRIANGRQTQLLIDIESILRRVAPERLRHALGAQSGGTPSRPHAATFLSPPPVSPAPDGGSHHNGTVHLPPSPAGGPSFPSHPPAPQPSPSEPTSPGSGGASEPKAPEPPPEEKPGLLNPALGTVCGATSALELCSPR